MRKFKKWLSVFLAAFLIIPLVSCNTDDGADDGDADVDDDTLVIWTLAIDLEDFAEKYEEETGADTEVVVIEPANYATKVQSALGAKETKPDIIVAEPQMLGNFYEAGYFASLDEFGAQEHEGEIVDYVWEAGQDEDGVQRAISYQITPAGIYYRRDIAKDVFGTDDPEEISELFEDYETILETGEKLKEDGYRIFASDAETNYFSGDEAWVVDGKLNLAQSRLDYMDMVIELYQQDLTAYANPWSTPWYQAMAGEVPILSAEESDINIWDEEEFNEGTEGRELTEVFAYGLPSWGVLTLRDNCGDTFGKWGLAQGPTSGFGGGTFLGISTYSENKEAAWDFIEFVTLNNDIANWWIDYSEGDTVSLISALEENEDRGVELFDGQEIYHFWYKEAENIDFDKVTKYDTVIGDAWGAAISAIKTGQEDKEAAIQEFYDVVESTYPDMEIDREAHLK